LERIPIIPACLPFPTTSKLQSLGSTAASRRGHLVRLTQISHLMTP
jgi:hypothetical protein